MQAEFSFFDLDSDDDLRFRANQVLDRILELSPHGSIAVAMLKKDQDLYRCAIDVYSKHGPFIAHSIQPTPLLALHHTQSILSDKLLSWRKSTAGRDVSARVDLLTAGKESPPLSV